MPDILPTSVALVPSSNCFCISPGPKVPRSPPFWKEPQSLRSCAYLAKTASVAPSAIILSMYVCSSAAAYTRVCTRGRARGVGHETGHGISARGKRAIG